MAVCVLLWTLPTFRAFAADVRQKRVGAMSRDIQVDTSIRRNILIIRNICNQFVPLCPQILILPKQRLRWIDCLFPNQFKTLLSLKTLIIAFVKSFALPEA